MFLTTIRFCIYTHYLDCNTLLHLQVGVSVACGIAHKALELGQHRIVQVIQLSWFHCSSVVELFILLESQTSAVVQDFAAANMKSCFWSCHTTQRLHSPIVLTELSSSNKRSQHKTFAQGPKRQTLPLMRKIIAFLADLLSSSGLTVAISQYEPSPVCIQGRQFCQTSTCLKIKNCPIKSMNRKQYRMTM